jgi:hypothetical protein
MAEIGPAILRRAARIGVLLCLSALSGCGDGPTLPVLAQPGFALSVSIPGLPDTTIQGESLYWRFVSLPAPAGGPGSKQLVLTLLVLDPPAPLLSPLEFELRWYELQADLPAERSYGLNSDRPDGVLFQAISNLGVWLSSKGGVQIDAVSDSSISGVLSATLVQYFPYDQSLPDVTVKGTFWAPRTTDF